MASLLNKEKWVLNLLLIICSTYVCAQRPSLFYNRVIDEKTKVIIKKYDPTVIFDTVNMFPIMVDYRLYTSKQMQGNLTDSGLFCKTAEIDTSYQSYPENEKITRQYVKDKISTKLSSKINIIQAKINREDMLFLKREIKRIKKLFKDSLISNYKMSDSLNDFFSRYSAPQEILVDVLFYHSAYHYPRSSNGYIMYRFYVFDIRIKQIVFYNYCTETIGANYKGLDYRFIGNNTAPIYRLVHDYKLYLKENTDVAGEIENAIRGNAGHVADAMMAAPGEVAAGEE